ELDGLQSWQMKQDLLFSDFEELAAYRNRGVATGTLPLKNMADWVLTNTEEMVSPIKELVSECIGTASEESLHIELEVNNTLLKGKLSRIYDGRLVFISF